MSEKPGWRWLKVTGVCCYMCRHLHTCQPAPGSDYESTCDHPNRGSSAPIPESCEEDPTGFDPSEEDESDADNYVPSWCGRMPAPDRPCPCCGGWTETRDDLCETCSTWIDEQIAEQDLEPVRPTHD